MPPSRFINYVKWRVTRPFSVRGDRSQHDAIFRVCKLAPRINHWAFVESINPAFGQDREQSPTSQIGIRRSESLSFAGPQRFMKGDVRTAQRDAINRHMPESSRHMAFLYCPEIYDNHLLQDSSGGEDFGHHSIWLVPHGCVTTFGEDYPSCMGWNQRTLLRGAGR